MANEGINGSICRQKKCCVCCLETEMPLNHNDATRITQNTHYQLKDFAMLKDGIYTLKNVHLNNRYQCFFLNNQGLCSIYSLRPEGCRYYPIIWHLDEDRAIVDYECPHHTLFHDLIPLMSKSVEIFVKNLLQEVHSDE